MANLDLDRLEALERGYAPEDRVMVQSYDTFTFGELTELLRRARELERRDVILRRLVAAVDVTRAKNATPAHEKELDDALDVAREVL